MLVRQYQRRGGPRGVRRSIASVLVYLGRYAKQPLGDVLQLATNDAVMLVNTVGEFLAAERKG